MKTAYTSARDVNLKLLTSIYAIQPFLVIETIEAMQGGICRQSQ